MSGELRTTVEFQLESLARVMVQMRKQQQRTMLKLSQIGEALERHIAEHDDDGDDDDDDSVERDGAVRSRLRRDGRNIGVHELL